MIAISNENVKKKEGYTNKNEIQISNFQKYDMIIKKKKKKK